MPDLLCWSSEVVKKEWWGRDGGMSTPDNRVWVFGDSPRYNKSGNKAGTLKSIKFGSEWIQDGAEQGQYPGVNGVAIGERRWPTGVCWFVGKLLVTFARVNVTKNGFSVIGHGWVYNGKVTIKTEPISWGCPRIQNGSVFVTRVDGFIPGAKVWQRKMSGGIETEVPGIPWSPEVHFQWAPGVSYCVRTVQDGWELLRSYDRINWTRIGGGASTWNDMTFWPHITPYGILVTWYDQARVHLVRELIAA